MTTICVVVYFGEFVFVWPLGRTLSGIGGGAEGSGWRGRGGGRRGGGGAEGSGGRRLIISGFIGSGQRSFTKCRALVGFRQ